ncbi:MAG: 2-C-methyl-D-erythritol 4-phosphate cytidylyltransferase [Candidatus Gastranaerophilaceae bacterium]|jgi:2-C-methyl-D-erythritol 4-phosphate cytidylyltransferase
MKISAIIPAAGSGSRYSKNKNKLLENLCGKPVFIHTIEKIALVDEINEIIICTSPDIIEEITLLIEKWFINNAIKIILGGETRQQSVYNGLKRCENPDFVLIHDAARPLIEKETIIQAINSAKEKGSAIVAVPSKDTIKIADDTLKITGTPDRKYLWNIQTPQIFKYEEILNAHERFKELDATDDAALLEKTGKNVYLFKGSYKNIKITTTEDLMIAEVLTFD